MLRLKSKSKCFDGFMESYTHISTVNQCEMAFSIYLPPQAKKQRVPTLYWLSGLTCTDENFTVKSGAQRYASEYGLALVIPDTSPRGAGVPTGDDFDLGWGAGFYVNALKEPWSKNYHMYDYVTKELPSLVEEYFPVSKELRSISGHSMGGHGALVVGLREIERYQSVSAFAPIVCPSTVPWGIKAFGHYLGDNLAEWEKYDATCLIKKRHRKDTILIDQGTKDQFLNKSIKPEIFEAACRENGQALILRLQQDYDHSYFFVSTFIREHIEFHAKRLAS